MNLENLSSTSRIWIFQSDRKLSADDQQKINQKLTTFIPEWAAHGQSLYGGYEVQNDYFVVVAVDESKAPPSGCSIDSMMHVIQGLGQELGIDFLNRLNSVIEDNGELRLISQQEFRENAKAGNINEETVVFNNLIQTIAELPQWKTTVGNSWHKNILQTI